MSDDQITQLQLDKEIDDIVRRAERHASRRICRLHLALTLSLAAVLLSGAALYFGGMVRVKPTRKAIAGFMSDPADLKIKGNRNSLIYHLPGCPNYDNIIPGNVRMFKTEADAQAARYRRARNCEE